MTAVCERSEIAISGQRNETLGDDPKSCPTPIPFLCNAALKRFRIHTASLTLCIGHVAQRNKASRP